MRKEIYAFLAFLVLILLLGCKTTKITTQSKTDVTTTAHVHDMEKFERNEPTCMREGNIEYYKCSACDKTFSDSNGTSEISDYSIPQVDHDFDLKERVEMNCEDDGYDILVCKNCGKEEYSNFESSLGHVFNENLTTTVEASCENPGYVLRVCSICNKEVRTSYTESLGHIENKAIEKTVIEANCLEEGYTKHTCLVCKKEYITDKVDALGHLIENEITIDATCDFPKTVEKACSRCDYTSFEVLEDAIGHDFDNGTCKNCNKTVNEINIITAYNRWNSLPCKIERNEDGSYEIYSESSYSIDTNGTNDRFAVITVKSEVLKELARNGVSALIFTPGSKDDNARAFGWQINDSQFDAINVGGNVYSEKPFTKVFYNGSELEGMLDNEGDLVFMMIHGRMAGDIGYLESFSLKVEMYCLNHKALEGTQVIVSKTCTEDGYTESICSVCGFKFLSDINEATGHDYELKNSYDSATCDHIKGTVSVCKVCGDIKEEIIEGKKNHNFNNGVCLNCGKNVSEIQLITAKDSNGNEISILKNDLTYTIDSPTEKGVQTILKIDKDILIALYNEGYRYITFAFSKIDDTGRTIYITNGEEVKGFNLFANSDPQTQYSWYVLDFANASGILSKYENGIELTLDVTNLGEGSGRGINCKIEAAKANELISLNTKTTESKNDSTVTYSGGFTGYYQFAIGTSTLVGKTKVKVTISVVDNADMFQLVDPITGTSSSVGRTLEVEYAIAESSSNGMVIFGFYFNHNNLPTDAVFTITYSVE